MNNEFTNREKIFFPLEQDEDGYPPADSESLWAIETTEGLYEIDNIPFFVRGISCCDLVSTNLRDGMLTFKKCEEKRGHRTLRVILFQAAEVQNLRDDLRKMGCDSELNGIKLVAIDVPSNVKLEKVLEFLKKGEKDGVWEYEEADV